MVSDSISRAAASWREIRAALIALAIAVGLADGCPLPTPRDRPIVKQRFGPDAVAAIDAIDRVRYKALAPFRPVGELFQLRQRWKLFSGASRNRFRMHVEARRDLTRDEWVLLYRPLDDEHDFLADELHYRRVRGTWNPSTTYGPRGSYGPYATWVAEQIFTHDPTFREVRVRMQKIRIGPRGGFTPTDDYVHPQWRRPRKPQ